MKQLLHNRKNFLRCLLPLLLLIIIIPTGCKNKAPSITNTGNADTPTPAPGISDEKSPGLPSAGQTDADTIKDTVLPEAFPRIDGSTATIPLSVALYCYVTGEPVEAGEAYVTHSKTSASYLNLLQGTTDLVIAYEPSESVYDEMNSSQTKLIMKPIGKDALVFLCNENNPVKSLTEEQLIDIYMGKITNWSQVGGNSTQIIPFQRAENSGSQTLLIKLVTKDNPLMEAPLSRKPGGMAEIISAVAEYTNENNALGYSVYYYTQNMYQIPGIRYMAVNNILPDNQSIQNDTYPYINEFYAAIREDEQEDSYARKLFDWLTGQEGQELIIGLGYVAVK